jgi:excisionase family DNA binding protein
VAVICALHDYIRNRMDKTDPQPLVHSPENAARRLGVSVRKIYDLITSGEIRSCKVGKRRLIPESELQSFVQRKLVAE